MLPRIISACFAIEMFITQAAYCSSQSLDLSLRFDRKTYKVGDIVRVNLVFANSSNRKVLILPTSQAYTANVFKFTRISGGKLGEIVRFGENSIDFIGLSREVVRLGAGRSYTWSLKGEIASTLPDFMGPNTRGLYLVFPGSAIGLPDFGQYRATARYVSGTENPINQLLHGERLWVGEVESKPSMIKILPKNGSGHL
jgi:hypothetical protein